MKILKWIAIVVAALIVLPALTLLALGHRPDAGKMHVSAEIAGSPQQVWQWIDDGARLKQWISWMVDVREPEPARRGVGSKAQWVMRDENNGGMVMTLDGTVKEYVPPTRKTIMIEAPQYGFSGDQTYQLTDLGNGRTRVDIDAQYRYTMWLASLMEPLVTPAARKKMTGDVARLKELVENGGTR